jgi:TonB family protein
MQEQTTRREAGTTWVGAAYENDRSRLGLAFVLLLVALAVLVVKDRDFWFGSAENSVADQTSPEWIPGSVAQTSGTPAAKENVHVAPVKNSTEPIVAVRTTRPASQTVNAPAVMPPMEVEVIAGDTRDTVHLGSNAAKIEMSPVTNSVASGSTVAEQAPATVAAERVQMSLAKATTPPQLRETPYPLLGRQTKVQGSVLLQAFIGADGVIRDLRVLSGPAILASAAREAASRWQFKPYLQNGQPVETQARITVNFTIKVLENGARDQMDTVVALSRGGE